MYRVEALRADNTAANPTQSMTLSAEYLVLYAPAWFGSQLKMAPPPLTAEIDICGVGGRDQTAVFTATQTVWFYWIWGDDTVAPLACLVSLNAPPTGPTLPSGYNFFCPAFPMIIADDGSLQLKAIPSSPNRTTTRIRGRKAFYANAIVKDFSNYFPLHAVPIDFSAVIPQGSTLINIEVDAELHNGTAQVIAGFITQWSAGCNDVNFSLYSAVPNYVCAMDIIMEVPINDNRQMWGLYSVSAGPITSTDCCIIVRGYSW